MSISPPLGPAELRRHVAAWIADDPDPVTAASLRELSRRAQEGEEEAVAELADAFVAPLQFGTAGLRGALGAGPNRMNRAVVLRAAAGLAAYVAASVAEASHDGDASPAHEGAFRVVIGYDARRNSHRFALDTAAVVVAAGGEALLMPQEWPTPVLAFAVRHLDADAGVMVTASHNPAADNGYKVYLGGRVVTDSGQGAQIVAPHDAAIAAHIAAVGAVADIPQAEDGWRTLGEDVREAYLAGVAAAAPAVPTTGDLRVVTTAMHGVGHDTLEKALRAAGLTEVFSVAAQAQPDPDFPTVAFPNPEEDGALDLAFEHARQKHADLIIAVDPDADRCAVAVPAPHLEQGWRRLTGDEFGALLGESVARSVAAARDLATSDPQTAAIKAGADQPVLGASIVSSRHLEAIARAHGLHHRSTLTGFKWISRVPGLVYGYEEALGYCVNPALVRDKDGISAAVRAVGLAATLKSAGTSLPGLLDELAVRDGVYASAPVTVRVQELSLIALGMTRLRTTRPTALGGSGVTRFVDLAEGLRLEDPDGVNGGAYDLPPTDGVLIQTQDGSRVIVRPSGTEPKLKAYLDVHVAVQGSDVHAARAEASGRLAAIAADVRIATGL